MSSTSAGTDWAQQPISALKSYLASNNVDHSKCFEKSELVRLCQATEAELGSTQAEGEGGGAARTLRHVDQHWKAVGAVVPEPPALAFRPPRPAGPSRFPAVYRFLDKAVRDLTTEALSDRGAGATKQIAEYLAKHIVGESNGSAELRAALLRELEHRYALWSPVVGVMMRKYLGPKDTIKLARSEVGAYLGYLLEPSVVDVTGGDDLEFAAIVTLLMINFTLVPGSVRMFWRNGAVRNIARLSMMASKHVRSCPARDKDDITHLDLVSNTAGVLNSMTTVPHASGVNWYDETLMKEASDRHERYQQMEHERHAALEQDTFSKGVCRWLLKTGFMDECVDAIVAAADPRNPIHTHSTNPDTAHPVAQMLCILCNLAATLPGDAKAFLRDRRDLLPAVFAYHTFWAGSRTELLRDAYNLVSDLVVFKVVPGVPLLRDASFMKFVEKQPRPRGRASDDVDGCYAAGVRAIASVLHSEGQGRAAGVDPRVAYASQLKHMQEQVAAALLETPVEGHEMSKDALCTFLQMFEMGHIGDEDMEALCLRPLAAKISSLRLHPRAATPTSTLDWVRLVCSMLQLAMYPHKARGVYAPIAKVERRLTDLIHLLYNSKFHHALLHVLTFPPLRHVTVPTWDAITGDDVWVAEKLYHETDIMQHIYRFLVLADPEEWNEVPVQMLWVSLHKLGKQNNGPVRGMDSDWGVKVQVVRSYPPGRIEFHRDSTKFRISPEYEVKARTMHSVVSTSWSRTLAGASGGSRQPIRGPSPSTSTAGMRSGSGGDGGGDGSPGDAMDIITQAMSQLYARGVNPLDVVEAFEATLRAHAGDPNQDQLRNAPQAQLAGAQQAAPTPSRRASGAPPQISDRQGELAGVHGDAHGQAAARGNGDAGHGTAQHGDAAADAETRTKKKKSKAKACTGCGVAAGEGVVLKRCACRVASYCGTECQKAHWPQHKEECKRARAAASGADT